MGIVGIGIDTARYGHVASFIREDRDPAAAAMTIREDRTGYEKFQRRLESLLEQESVDELMVRIDAGGQYAENLQKYLSELPLPIILSVGEPKRNRDYHKAMSPSSKTDKDESWALARYSVAERPAATVIAPPEFVALREVAGRLQSQSRETTRHINQLHLLVARTFPELEFHVQDVSASYCLKLLEKYPTADRIGAAHLSSLKKIPYMKEEVAEKLHAAARESIASLKGEVIEELVRQSVRKLQKSLENKKQLETLLVQAFRQLPEMGQEFLTSIPGIGEVTAAALTAKIFSIDRFETEKQLVSYFGVFPEFYASGFEKDGTPKPPRQRMSHKGNDLVRACLWNAAKAAIRCNPDVKALYARKRSEGKRGDTALGHCMRKLVHQAFHVWKKREPYRPHAQPSDEESSKTLSASKTAVGPKVVNATERSEVTTATSSVSVETVNARPQIDFPYLRSQITIAEVMDHLAILGKFRGSSEQLRGPCPFHAPQSENGRSFSVNLSKNVFQCFKADCEAEGDVIDFWATWQQLPSYDAALHLARTFNLELTRTEKRNP